MDVANPDDIERIVRAVLKSINTPGAAAPAAKQCAPGVFDELDDAVAAAAAAQKQLKSVAMRSLVVDAIRRTGVEHARQLAELAVAETGMGRVDDKIAKNLSQARHTPGVECLTPRVLSGLTAQVRPPRWSASVCSALPLGIVTTCPSVPAHAMAACLPSASDGP